MRGSSNPQNFQANSETKHESCLAATCLFEHIYAAETGPRSSETFTYFGYLNPGYAQFEAAELLLSYRNA